MSSHFIAKVEARSEPTGDVISQYEIGGTIPLAEGHQTEDRPHKATIEKIYSHSLEQAKAQFYGMATFYFDIISYREVTQEEYIHFFRNNPWATNEGV